MMDYYDRCKVLSRVPGAEQVLNAQSLFQLGGNVPEWMGLPEKWPQTLGSQLLLIFMAWQ